MGWLLRANRRDAVGEAARRHPLAADPDSPGRSVPRPPLSREVPKVRPPEIGDSVENPPRLADTE